MSALSDPQKNLMAGCQKTIDIDSGGHLLCPTPLSTVRRRRRRVKGEPVFYSLLCSPRGFYTVRLRFRGKTVRASSLTSSRTLALSFFRHLVSGRVLPDTFFDIVDDFLAELALHPFEK